uniref:guanylate cyclase n=1 Tax=Timema californicum TaxID=61474 RepID=A0A7R9JBP1_TIMCA|nr:unnamed protein product [Timema californicum]
MRDSWLAQSKGTLIGSYLPRLLIIDVVMFIRTTHGPDSATGKDDSTDATKFETLGVTEHEFFDQMGVYFVGFVGQYGYDRVLSVLGRHMRDFLNGLDNLHEYLKFSYPRMRAPSFICENETRHGLTLHYRSKRRGFVYYTMGQIRESLGSDTRPATVEFGNERMSLPLLTSSSVCAIAHNELSYSAPSIIRCAFHFPPPSTTPLRELSVSNIRGYVPWLQTDPSPTTVFYLPYSPEKPKSRSTTTIPPRKDLGVARHFYHKEMRIELVREEILFDTVHVTFQLTFDNRAFTLASLTMTREEKHLPISASMLFEIFPFCIVFGSDMVVRSMGNSLMVILPDLVSKKITNWFDLVRPLIAFKFETILNRTNNIFELVTVEPVLTERPPDRKRNEVVLSDESNGGPDDKTLRLKGQMIYMDNWRMMMYLGTPMMPDLNSLITTGLYINDLSMHDFSRDLMLAGTQQSVELKLALDQEQQKSKKLEESMRKLDEEMKRTDELLYQMIPKQVADRLRTGESPIDTCETGLCTSGKHNRIEYQTGTQQSINLEHNRTEYQTGTQQSIKPGTQKSIKLEHNRVSNWNTTEYQPGIQQSIKLEHNRVSNWNTTGSDPMKCPVGENICDKLCLPWRHATALKPWGVYLLQMFNSVSILFSDVVTFTEICSRITPMEVVSMLNAMYSIFDTLTERNGVYKVETIGDAYMVVSGAPEKEQSHAEKVCDMALDMVEAITDLKDPSTGTKLAPVQ